MSKDFKSYLYNKLRHFVKNDVAFYTEIPTLSRTLLRVYGKGIENSVLLLNQVKAQEFVLDWFFVWLAILPWVHSAIRFDF